MGHINAMDMGFAGLAFIDGLGAPEMVLIFVIVLVLFGGQKLPEFARGLGKSIREFKKAAAGVEEEFKRALEEDERKNAKPQLTAAPPVETSPSTAHDYHYDEGHDQYAHDEYGNPITPGTPATATDVTTDLAGPASVPAQADAAATGTPAVAGESMPATPSAAPAATEAELKPLASGAPAPVSPTPPGPAPTPAALPPASPPTP